MIRNARPNRFNSIFQRLLLCVCILFFTASAFANDYRKIESFLGRAVAEGMVSLEEASVMLDALIDLRQGDDDDDEDEDEDEEAEEVIAELKEDMQEFGHRLKVAVKAGKLTEELAWEKWNWFLDNEIGPELKEEVAEGEISEEQAWDFWKAVKPAKCTDAKTCGKEKAKAKAKPKKPVDIQAVARRIRAAVQSGSMTPEQARAKMAEIRKAAAKKTAPAKKGKPAANKAAAKKAATRDKAKGKPNAKELKGDFNLEAAGKRIREAVKAGKITEKQARQKWDQVKKNQLKPRLEAAVKAGKMTREQVRRVWEGIRIIE